MKPLRWFFTDHTTGRYVIAQWPNLPLWIWIAATALHKVIDATWLGWVATAGLVVWAALEVWSGASPFRRVLGAGVLVAQAVSWVLAS